MTTLRMLISFCLLCSGVIAAETEDICGRRTVYEGTVFSLQIKSAFGGGIGFKLCARREAGKTFILVTRDQAGKTQKPTIVPLDHGTYQKLLTLYDNALDYNVKDDEIGLDGSIWCLETDRGMTYSKACFWSPGLNPEQRRLTGLFKLGQELWVVASKEPGGSLPRSLY